MRYKFAVLIFALFSLFATAATAGPEPVEANKMNVSATIDVGTNAKELIEHSGEAVSKMVDRLAAALGTTVEKIFPYYVKQAYLNGLVPIVIWAGFQILSLILFGVAFVLTAIYHKRDPEGRDFTTCFWVGATIVSFIVTGISLVVSGICLADWITLVNNPEYNAVSTLMKGAAQFKGR